jgi:hypothetical protein
MKGKVDVEKLEEKDSLGEMVTVVGMKLVHVEEEPIYKSDKICIVMVHIQLIQHFDFIGLDNLVYFMIIMECNPHIPCLLGDK